MRFVKGCSGKLLRFCTPGLKLHLSSRSPSVKRAWQAANRRRAMGTICESRRGVRLPCRRCRPSSGLSLKPHPYLALDKADGIATLTLGMVEPLVAADGDAGVAGGTILSTGANGAFALGAQQRYQVGILRPRLFLRREINKFSHSFFSVWIDVVPLAARGTLWYNFSP